MVCRATSPSIACVPSLRSLRSLRYLLCLLCLRSLRSLCSLAGLCAALLCAELLCAALLCVPSLCAARPVGGERAQETPTWTGWLALETHHFRVRFPAHLELLGRRAAEVCEEAWREITPLYGYAPDARVEVTLLDLGDDPNGFATTIGWPRIALFAAPPHLDEVLHHYDDWLRLLIYHEFAHILQLHPVGEAWRALNALIGRQVAPNQALPSAVLEGGATWVESAVTRRGRLRSAIVHGQVRAQAFEGSLPTIDELLHTPERWPGASAWYLHGGLFFEWLVAREGVGWLAPWHERVGASLLPFAINEGIRERLGSTYEDLYGEWRQDYTREALRWREAREPITPPALTAAPALRRGHPALDPSGALWVWEGGRRGPQASIGMRPLRLRTQRLSPLALSPHPLSPHPRAPSRSPSTTRRS